MEIFDGSESGNTELRKTSLKPQSKLQSKTFICEDLFDRDKYASTQVQSDQNGHHSIE